MSEAGKRSVTLQRLRELDQVTFSIADIFDCMDSTDPYMHSARRRACELVKAGCLIRVAHGLYAFPDEPVDTLRRSFRWQLPEKAVASHATAMALHGFAVQGAVEGDGLPEIVLTSDRRRPNAVINGKLRVRYVDRRKPRRGETVELAHPAVGPLSATTLEDTLIDALAAPRLCGGLAEVCRFIAWGHDRWDPAKLKAAADREGTRAMARRLACLFAWAKHPAAAELAVAVYNDDPLANLDANGPRRGKVISEWRLRLNADRAAVLAALTSRTATPPSAV